MYQTLFLPVFGPIVLKFSNDKIMMSTRNVTKGRVLKMLNDTDAMQNISVRRLES